MTEKKEIKWQFAEDYYKYLIKKLQRIDYYLQLEEFGLAFEEMRQIYTQINESISSGEPEIYQALSSKIPVITNLIMEYEIMKNKENKSRNQMINETRLKYQVNNEIYMFYHILMGVINKLNMLFPTEVKKDWRGKEVLMPHG